MRTSPPLRKPSSRPSPFGAARPFWSKQRLEASFLPDDRSTPSLCRLRAGRCSRHTCGTRVMSLWWSRSILPGLPLESSLRLYFSRVRHPPHFESRAQPFCTYVAWNRRIVFLTCSRETNFRARRATRRRCAAGSIQALHHLLRVPLRESRRIFVSASTFLWHLGRAYRIRNTIRGAATSEDCSGVCQRM